MSLVQIGNNIDWTWERGPLLNQQFPWHYPQPHTFGTVNGADVWGARRRIGLYLHVPFCEEKCDYCPYAVRAKQPQEKIKQYVDALKREVEICGQLPSMRAAEVTSIYFGGGSPSILENEWLLDLNQAIRSHFDIATNAEYTLEMNPIDVEEDKLSALDEMGVNRISIGVQSFNAETLKSMRRAHTAERAVTAFRTVQQFRFKNINLDLIYAYPNQTMEELAANVKSAIALKPGRITPASLSIFPKTELYYKVKKGLAAPAPDTREIEMFKFLVETLPAAGYELSVVLAFNKPGIHFLQEEELLLGRAELVGLGLSAFSVANNYVYSNSNSFAEYYKLVRQGVLSITRGRHLDRQKQMAMSVIHGLRFLRVDGHAFRDRFNVPLEEIYGTRLRKLEDGGLLWNDNGVYRLTMEGMICLGPIMREFYQDPPLFNKTYHGEMTAAEAGAAAVN
jgi:oxygen-independent coproporphyrinogen III oxidase